MLTHLFRACVQLGRPLPRAIQQQLASSWSCAASPPLSLRTPSCASSSWSFGAESGAPVAPRPTACSSFCWPAGNPAVTASAGSPLLLASKITSPVVAAAEGSGRNDRADPGAGRGRPALGGRAHPQRVPEGRHPRGQGDAPAAPARRSPAAPGSPRRRSSAITPTRSEPATSSRSPISSSVPCTPPSWSCSARAAWPTSA